MEIEVIGIVPDFILDEKAIGGDHDPKTYCPWHAPSEYSILDEFPDLKDINLSDYAEIDSVYRYDPFDAIDTEAAIVGIITE